MKRFSILYFIAIVSLLYSQEGFDSSQVSRAGIPVREYPGVDWNPLGAQFFQMEQIRIFDGPVIDASSLAEEDLNQADSGTGFDIHDLGLYSLPIYEWITISDNTAIFGYAVLKSSDYGITGSFSAQLYDLNTRTDIKWLYDEYDLSYYYIDEDHVRAEVRLSRAHYEKYRMELLEELVGAGFDFDAAIVTIVYEKRDLP